MRGGPSRESGQDEEAERAESCTAAAERPLLRASSSWFAARQRA